MYLQNPYDFRTLKLLKTDDIISAVNRYIVTDLAFYSSNTNPFNISSFHFTGDYLQPVVLYGKSPMEKDIPIFGHPLYNRNNKWLAVDLRQCTKIDKESGKVEIRNQAEFSFAVCRFVLSGLWCTDRGQALYNNHLPMLVYGDWLSQNLTRVLGLGMGDQVRLFVLACMFYSTLFTESYGKEEKEKFILKIKNHVAYSDLVEEIVGKVDKLDTIDDFCEMTYKVTDNVRLKNLNFVGLINIISNNWYGLNAGEITAVSLVHPPTWVSLVYAAISERGYRNTNIAKITENRSRRGIGADFVKEIATLVKNNSGE